MGEVISSSNPTARKQHSCSFCGQPIKQGEQYEKTTMVGDGLYHWKAHPSCTKLTEVSGLFVDCGHEGVTRDDFIEMVHDVYASESEVDADFSTKLDFVKRKLMEETK